MLTDKTVAAEGILSFVSPLSRLSGYPPYRILRKFTRAPVPVSSWNAARDMTGPWGMSLRHINFIDINARIVQFRL